jgi:hypothetical protein
MIGNSITILRPNVKLFRRIRVWLSTIDLGQFDQIMIDYWIKKASFIP